MSFDREGPAAQAPAQPATPAPPAPGRQTLTPNPTAAHPGNAAGGHERGGGNPERAASGVVASGGNHHAGPHEPAAPPQSIAQQFPQGITVAIALAPEDPQIVAQRILASHQTLAQLIAHHRAQLIPCPATTRLHNALRQGDHPVTATEAYDCATVLAANDRAFGRAAHAFAAGHPVVGGDPAQPRVGQPMIFQESQNAVAMVRQLSQAVGPLPGAHDAGNIHHLAIFTHGWHTGLRLGSFSGGANAFVAQLSGVLTHDVTIGMYGCNAAGSDVHDPGPSFAQNVTEGLAHAGHDVRVFGHDNAAHTTLNPRGREFRATAGQTTPAKGHSNHDMVFPASYRAQQVARIAREMNVPPADVDRVFEDVTARWLVNAMPRIQVRGGQRAAFQMGFDPDGAIAACQEAWQSEGLAAIRHHLQAANPAQTSRSRHHD